MVTIKGKRQRAHEVTQKDFFYKELYWGTFSRSILMPQEVDSDAAQATLKNGLLTIKIPKQDKSKKKKKKKRKEKNKKKKKKPTQNPADEAGFELETYR